MQQWYELNYDLVDKCKENDKYIAKNYQQKVRLERLQYTLTKTLEILELQQVQEYTQILKQLEETKELLWVAQKEAKQACAAQKIAEDRLKEANSLRQQAIKLLQG